MDKNIACSLFDTNYPKSELRATLLAARQTWQSDPKAKDPHPKALAQRIYSILVKQMPQCTAFYWPIAGEFDLRTILTQWLSQYPTRCAALPAVIDTHQPLSFYLWQPNTAVKKGRFQIPAPVNAVKATPDLLLIPCVGFDTARYRLGYGGGYYDRTLAALSPRPFTVGIAYDRSRVDKLPRDSYDIPLDLIVTECGRYE